MNDSSQENIEQRAEEIRSLLHVEACKWLDIQTVLTNLRRVFPEVDYRLVDQKLPNNALAQWVSEECRIIIPRTTYAEANFPTHNPRSRFSVIHEVTHVFEGHEGKFNRAQSRTDIPVYAKNLKSVERRTDAIAAAILAPRNFIKSTDTFEDIAQEFGISIQAAKLRVDEVRKSRGASRNRPKYVEDLLQELSGKTDTKTPIYADKLCNHCGEKRLFAIGVGYLCDNCDTPQTHP